MLTNQSERHCIRSLRASSLGCSGGAAGKGGRACNYVSGIWICALKKSMRNADWRKWVITLGTCFSTFVYIRACFRFTLIDENLTAQSTVSHRAIGGETQILVTLLQALAPSFSHPATRAPRRACSQATKLEGHGRSVNKSNSGCQEICSLYSTLFAINIV